jgi:membrane protease YdiL (CAAX protease family)
MVAIAEECFVRGALFDAVQQVRGDTAAVLIGAIAFAALRPACRRDEHLHAW